MNDYQIIYNILLNVHLGKNLNEQFNKYESQIKNYSKIKNITFGSLRSYYWIEEILANVIKLDNHINNLVILRIAIYEIYYSNKKTYAIVNDIVNLAKSNKIPFTFINAILRKIVANKDILFNKINNQNNLQIKYNLPQWIIDKLENYTSQDLSYFKEEPYISIRVNLLKISLQEYRNKLSDNNISYILVDENLVITSKIKITELPLFNDGYIFIQDIGAQFFSNLFDKYIGNKSNILDTCAAPGGKLTSILEKNNYRVTALDISDDRINLVRDNLSRLNLNCDLLLADASQVNFENKFDFIIADVPCSATGTIKRNPDIIITRKKNDIINFVNLQRSIIDNVWQYLDYDGILIYATCSVLEEENSQNIKYFMQKYTDFNLIDQIYIKPSLYNDGFYYAVIRKYYEA